MAYLTVDREVLVYQAYVQLASDHKTGRRVTQGSNCSLIEDPSLTANVSDEA